jgi:hypothetical protein
LRRGAERSQFARIAAAPNEPTAERGRPRPALFAVFKDGGAVNCGVVERSQDHRLQTDATAPNKPISRSGAAD